MSPAVVVNDDAPATVKPPLLVSVPPDVTVRLRPMFDVPRLVATMLFRLASWAPVVDSETGPVKVLPLKSVIVPLPASIVTAALPVIAAAWVTSPLAVMVSALAPMFRPPFSAIVLFDNSVNITPGVNAPTWTAPAVAEPMVSAL